MNAAPAIPQLFLAVWLFFAATAATAGNSPLDVPVTGLPGDDVRIIRLLVQMQAAEKYTAAICAAPRVLAEAGLLDGKRATSYPGSLDINSVPGLEYVDQPVVTDGKVITSRGPGTAMDFALELIETLSGKQVRVEVEAGLQRPAG